MKIDQIIDAIGKIKPEYVKEAEQWKPAESSNSISTAASTSKSTAASGSTTVSTTAKKWPLSRKMRHLLPLAACLALVVLGSTYGFWQYNSAHGKKESVAESMESAYDNQYSQEAEAEVDKSDDVGMAEGQKDVMESAKEETAGNDGSGQSDASASESAEIGNEAQGHSGETKIKINEVNELSTMIACGSAPARQEVYTAEELEAYYGVTILPKQLPEDLTLSEKGEQIYSVGYNEEGKVMDDNNRLTYQNSSGSRKLEITVWNVEMGEITRFANDDLKKSKILGNEVTIGHFKNGTSGQETDGYLATFEKCGINFSVQSNGLAEEEFISILTGLM